MPLRRRAAAQSRIRAGSLPAVLPGRSRRPALLLLGCEEPRRCAPGRSAAAPRLFLALLLDPRPPVASSATATCRPQGLDFAAGTGFPADRLLADVDNAAYEALAFKRGLRCV